MIHRTSTVLSADFTGPTRSMKAKGEPGWLHLCRIEAGRRTILQTIRVAAQSRFFHRYDAGYRYDVRPSSRAPGWKVAVYSASGHFLTFV